MPIANGTTYALVIVSLGILGVIISFQVADRKKYFMSLGLSLFVVCLGLFQYVGASLQQWRMSRRIEKLQESQRLNLEALQSRLREAAENAQKGRPSASAEPPAMPSLPLQSTAAPSAPAPSHRRRK